MDSVKTWHIDMFMEDQRKVTYFTKPKSSLSVTTYPMACLPMLKTSVEFLPAAAELCLPCTPRTRRSSDKAAFSSARVKASGAGLA